MRPEFPHWFNPMDRLFFLLISQHDIECEMLKVAVGCGNDAELLLIGDRGGGKGHACVAMCRSCWEEVGLGTVVEELHGEEITAYWREKQREWGVR